MTFASWMEDRANASSDFEFACSGNCETGKREARLEEINEAIAEIKQRGLHIPLSLSAERDELDNWLNENGECKC